MRILTLTIFLSFLSSCGHQPPYELKSPCVSEDTNRLDSYNPCIRKPINLYIV